jgi:tetratricopeptide (TPR) repeat protein
MIFSKRMHLPRRLILMAALVVALLPPQRARADEEDAKAIFDRGAAMFALHRFDEAAALFEKAFSIKPDAAILYNAAKAHRLAGNKARALELYESLLRIYGDRIAHHDEIIEYIRELHEELANAPPPVPHPSAKDTPPPPPITPGADSQLTRPAPSRRPVYKRGWFWGVMGGAAVVVAGAIVAGVVVGTHDSTRQLPDFRF